MRCALAEKRHEHQQHQVRVHLRLEFEVARELLAADGAPSALERQRGVQRVVDFFHERDERADVRVA